MNIYQENILDHYKNPRNFGKLKNPDIVAKDANTLCGDEIEIQIKLKDGKIEDIRFSGPGCAISRASGSMLTEYVKGKSVDEVKGEFAALLQDVGAGEIAYWSRR